VIQSKDEDQGGDRNMNERGIAPWCSRREIAFHAPCQLIASLHLALALVLALQL
jgi:hypothetical protein